MSFKESKVHRGSCEFRRYVVIVYRASVIERLYKTTKKVGAVKVTTCGQISRPFWRSKPS
jgi:hypothetical protein